MAVIECTSLSSIPEQQLIDLMNDEDVRRQMPLLGSGFSHGDCRDFLAVKQKMWDEHGYGPWAFLINGKFAGWGGLQPEDGEADFALVLHPSFWGWGLKIFQKIKAKAFGEMGLVSITILLPPSRPNSKAVTRMGFIEDGRYEINGETFIKFRLLNQ